MFPTFHHADKYFLCMTKVVQFHYLYLKAFSVVAFKSRAMQVSGVLMCVTYLLSLYQSVNSSVWGLCACMCARALVHRAQDLSMRTSLSVSGPLTRLSARHRSDRWLRCQLPVLSVSWYRRAGERVNSVYLTRSRAPCSIGRVRSILMPDSQYAQTEHTRYSKWTCTLTANTHF